MSGGDGDLRLPLDAALVGQARRFASRAAEELGADDDAVDAVRSLVSELMANVVLHAGTETLLRVRDGGGTVLVEVVDGSPVPVAQRRITDASTTGRGLRLLHALSEHHEVRPCDDVRPGGKAVRFTVRKRTTEQVRRAAAEAAQEAFAVSVSAVDGAQRHGA